MQPLGDEHNRFCDIRLGLLAKYFASPSQITARPLWGVVVADLEVASGVRVTICSARRLAGWWRRVARIRRHVRASTLPSRSSVDRFHAGHSPAFASPSAGNKASWPPRMKHGELPQANAGVDLYLRVPAWSSTLVDHAAGALSTKPPSATRPALGAEQRRLGPQKQQKR